MIFSEALELFKLDQRSRGNSEKTLIYYDSSLSHFGTFFGIKSDLSTLDLTLCQNYVVHLLNGLKLNSVSIQSYVRALRSFLSWCFDNNIIATDICYRFKLPKAKRNIIDVLSDEEISRLLNAVSGSDWLTVRNRLIVALMLDSGLRLNEVVGLLASNVHVEERYMIVTGKGNKQRLVPFGEFTYHTLKQYLSSRGSFGISSSLLIKVSLNTLEFEPITESTVKNFFKRLKLRSEIPRLYPHLLRHTFATRYLENGGNIYSLQAILGHTSLEMVKKYLHLATNRIRADFPRFSPLDNIKKEPPKLDGS